MKKEIFLPLLLVFLIVPLALAAQPSGKLISPANSTQTSSSTITFRANATDSDGDLSNMSFYIWNMTDWGGWIIYDLVYINTTIVTGSFNQTQWNYTFLSDRQYNWDVLVSDANGDYSWASGINWTVFVDTIPPVISLLSVADGTYTSDNRPGLCYRFDDNFLGCKNITIFIWNLTSGNLYENRDGGMSGSDGFTGCSYGQLPGLPNGDYFWGILGFDLVEHSTWSQQGNWTFTIDTVNPTANIIYPTAVTYAIDISELNYTYSDTNPGSCRYSTDNGATYSAYTSAGLNFTNALSSEGVNNWKLNCNDLASNAITKTVTFTRDLYVPYFLDNTPYNDEIGNDTYYFQHVNATDDGVGLDCFSLNDTSFFTINCSGYMTNSTILPIGSYNLNVTVNDSLNRINSSVIRINVILGEIEPDAPNLNLVSIDGNDYDSSDLNCSGRITDPNLGDVMNMTIEWYKNNLLDFTIEYNNSYANSTFFSAVLKSGNTSANDIWRCKMRAHDGKKPGAWGESRNLSIVSAPAPSSGSSTGGGRPSPRGECFYDSNCMEGYFCSDYKCIKKLLDIKIIDFESPTEPGDFFDFAYLIKLVSGAGGDVKINFWIEQDGQKITSGQDIIYFEGGDEKTEKTKIFIPSSSEQGNYIFYVEAEIEPYKASSYRQIEINESESWQKGKNSIMPDLLKKIAGYLKNLSKSSFLWIVSLWIAIPLLLIITFWFLLSLMKRTKKNESGLTRLKNFRNKKVFDDEGNKIGKVQEIYIKGSRINSWLIRFNRKTIKKIRKEELDKKIKTSKLKSGRVRKALIKQRDIRAVKDVVIIKKGLFEE